MVAKRSNALAKGDRMVAKSSKSVIAKGMAEVT